MHTPVLLKEVINGLQLRREAFVIDGTLGAGGHAREIIQRIPSGIFLGIDRDPEAIERFSREQEQTEECAVTLFAANYGTLIDILRAHNFGEADGLLLDLGFSSDQLESSGRGFSFKRDEPLHMTYELNQTPAKTVLRELNRRQLAEIIRAYSDERFAGKIADAIKDRLKKDTIETSRELADVISAAVPKTYERGRIHPATRTFQALRIHVNDELGALKKLLADIEWIVRPGGRIAIISFHSLEDRIVKNTFREKEKEKVLKIITKKPIIADEEEIRRNPRARSAKLRLAEVT